MRRIAWFGTRLVRGRWATADVTIAGETTKTFEIAWTILRRGSRFLAGSAPKPSGRCRRRLGLPRALDFVTFGLLADCEAR